jgi:hypothetical protein
MAGSSSLWTIFLSQMWIESWTEDLHGFLFFDGLESFV